MGDRSFRLSFSPQRHGSLECVNRKKQPVEKYERGTRSYTMSHIRGKDTKIEVLVRSYLFRKGLRFRKNDKRYPGHPDVVLPKYHAIVFVNGCFWHMHEGCSKHSMPKSNVEFWQAKLLRNHNRDIAQRAELEAAGWRVITVWECELTKAVRDLLPQPGSLGNRNPAGDLVFHPAPRGTANRGYTLPHGGTGRTGHDQLHFRHDQLPKGGDASLPQYVVQSPLRP